MAKASKNRLIETITHKSGQKADIYFNTDRNEFYCSTRAVGVDVESADFNTVKAEVIKRLDELGNLTWIPVIHVELWKANGTGCNAYQQVGSVRMRIARYWVAFRKNGANPLRSWDWQNTRETTRMVHEDDSHYPRPVKVQVPVDREQGAEEITHLPHNATLPYFRPSSGGGWYDACDESIHPYNEELWIGLNKVMEAIQKANKQVAELVTTPEGSDHLKALAETWKTFAISSGTADPVETTEQE